MLAYLDHAASTPVRPEALEAMLPFLRDHYGNPSGMHGMAREARKAIDEARDVMATVLGAQPGEIVFTGGGTESDNLAVLGVHDLRSGTVVCSAIEHHAVLDAVESRHGHLADVDQRGVIDLHSLAATLEELAAAGQSVSLVSVMLVNNEVGSVQPIEKIAKLVRRHAPGAYLHTDAIQALAWLDVAPQTRSADLMSVSAHKFGGPKGVGVLVVREGVELAPRTFGGGQERERRSGTQNVAGIVGMAAAARIAADERAAVIERVTKLRDRLADGLSASIAPVVETGVAPAADGMGPDRSHKVPGICHVCIPGVDSESLLFLLDKAGVCASAASSCASGAMEPSHVLAAMGVPADVASGSLRLSLGWSSTDDDVDQVLNAMPPAVERLRMFS